MELAGKFYTYILTLHFVSYFAADFVYERYH